MSTDIGFDTQTPSLPEGGGAIAGLGETFTPDLSTGTASFSIRLDCPNGPNDIGPRLSLRYDTAAGNGAFGVGYTISLPRLVRSTANGYPKYDATDVLMLEGVGELVALDDGTYRPQVDDGAWRAARSGQGFRLIDREGLYYDMGVDASGRLADETETRVFAWHLERIEDALGNAATFTWVRDNSQLYLSKLAYGAYEVRFTYENRPDPIRWGRSGFLVKTNLRCASIELHLPSAPQSLVRRWTLGYTQLQPSGASGLSLVTLTGFDEAATPLSAPRLKLAYSGFATRALERFESVDPGAAPGPLSRTDRRVELLDWNGDGLPDLLEVSPGGRARYWPNLGQCSWGRPQTVADLPMFASASASVAFADMNGDGLADMVPLDRPIAGFVPRIEGAGFGEPVRWRQAPAVQPSSPNARLVDLDGDGIVDLIASTSDALQLYYRRDPEGWSSSPQIVMHGEGPDVDLADPHVSLADMTGDGSPDVVRVDGGGVTYWPYLGNGRWAPAVSMANPPELPLNVRSDRLFVSDVDGDGCADLVYLDLDRVLYWINQSGNGFSDVRVVDYVPTGQITQARIADMRGSAAPGLLWSIPAPFNRGASYFYLDFCGDTKPYLLDQIDNGVGSITTITYTTSAREAAAAASTGQPWRTSLPVVVPVVSKRSVQDVSTGRVTSTVYHYHDGRYDGVLREFAGFGHVEQDDLGDIWAPTLRTSSWFHIGVDPAHVNAPMTLDERRRLRAIRGRIYKQDRYSLDGSAQQDAPYDRLEQQWTVDTFDTASGPIDLPRQAKSIRSVFERQAMPVATMTTVNSAWDAAGNVTDAIQTSAVAGDPAQSKVLRTLNSYAADATGRFTNRLWRAKQFDGPDGPDGVGSLVADVITEFDHALEGTTGTQGLVTRKTALVLSDALVTQVYGASPPDFAARGYHRRPGEDGWWIDQARYTRTDDAAGLRGAVTGPLGSATSFTFDANKTYPASVSDPRGNTMTAVYDYRVCRIKALADASGATYQTTFDALARPTAGIHPRDTAALPTVTYAYVVNALPVTAESHRRAISGNPATIDAREMYDGSAQPIERRVRDDSGEIIEQSIVYAARGFKARHHLERRPSSAAYVKPDDTWPHIGFFYDALGRLVRQENADGSVKALSYGPLSITESDEEDNRAGGPHANTPTVRRIDSTGRVQAIEQNLGGRTLRSTYAYDVKGNLVTHTDANGVVVRMDYDFLGRTIRVSRPEQTTLSVFDAAGNAVEARTATGSLVFREFDENNRPVSIKYLDRAAPAAIQFTYHDAGHPAPPDAGAHTDGGRCVRIDDEGGTTVFDYDETGRAAVKRSTPKGLGRTLELNLAYRADGQLSAVTYPDMGQGRTTVSYNYDARGKVSGVPGFVNAIEYDLTGARSRVAYANGVDQRFDYEATTGRLSAIRVAKSANVLRDTQYTWDFCGNLSRIASANPKLAAAYGLDDLYRLTQADTTSGRTWTYTYDDSGNLTHKSDVGDYRYGENGAPATCLTSAGTQKFTYTSLGEMKDTPWGTQTFNVMGRLTQIVGPAGTGQMDFGYDYAGVRVSAKSSGGASPVVDTLTPDPLYSIESGALVLNIFDGQGIVARQRDGAVPIYLHADHLGGVAMVTDATGAVTDEIFYDPYGAVLERSGAGPGQPIGFTGGAPDVWSGLLYLQARYYHPGLGRFVSADPIVLNVYDPIAWSPYIYCGDNPVTFVDPTGRGFWAIFLAAVAIVALVVLSIVTFGAATGLLVVGIGIIAGGIVGGLAAAAHGGNVDDILTGIFVGAAVGGWAAFATMFAGGAVASGLGLGVHSFWGAVVAGAVNGAIDGAAIGFASGFAGGKGSLDEIWKKTLEGLAIGLVTGAVVGGVAHYLTENPSTQSTWDQVRHNLQPHTPPAPPAGLPPNAPTALAPAPEINSFSQAASKVATGIGGKIAAPIAEAAARYALTGPLAMAAMTLTVDAAAGAWDLGYVPYLLRKAGVMSFSGKF